MGVNLNIPREKQSVELWNVCTCGAILHSISEGKRGTCSSCWIRDMDPSKKAAMNKVIAAAFNGSTNAEKDAAVDGVLQHFRDDK